MLIIPVQLSFNYSDSIQEKVSLEGEDASNTGALIHACSVVSKYNPMERGAWWVTVHAVAKSSLSRRLSQQEYWSGLSFPPSGDLPDPGTEPPSPVSPALTGRIFSSAPLGSPTFNTNTWPPFVIEAASGSELQCITASSWDGTTLFWFH